MANILIHPNSGIIEFSTGLAGGEFFNTNFTGGALASRLNYDNFGGINITSYVSDTSGLERFSIDGANGRLFSVTDNLSGSLFSVNDIAGLPILEVKDFNTVIAGKFNTNALVVSGSQVALGLMPYDASRLGVSGNVNVIGNITASGNINASGANFQNLQKFITGLSTGIDSYTGIFQYPFSNTPVLSAAITYTGAYGYMSNFSNVTLTGFVLDFSDIIKESGVELSIIAYG